jgi:hypothetical protein
LGKGVQSVSFGWSHILIALGNRLSDRRVFLRQCLETGDVTGGGNRLGTGFDFDTSSPKAIDFKTEAQVIALESGHFHNLALTGQYRLF